jgi:dephospho-CoA kinase
MIPFKLGLTGSIGMGKSTTARFFKEEGCEVWDADSAVHRLYQDAAVAPIGERFPTAIVNGVVDRTILKQIISDDPKALKTIEDIVHPLVAQDRARFIENATADILVFDIPLLFETKGHLAMVAVACVTVPDNVQRDRVMERRTMTLEQFEHIKAKQMPNKEKCELSDYVIETLTLEGAQRHVQDIVKGIREDRHA